MYNRVDRIEHFSIRLSSGPAGGCRVVARWPSCREEISCDEPLPIWIVSLALLACEGPRVREIEPGASNPQGPSGGGGATTPGGGGGFTLPDPMMVRPTATDGAPIQCAAEAHRAESVPLELMLLVDTSMSMTGRAGMRTKWETVQLALRNFVADPGSAGLGVGLQFFPQEKTCQSDGDCVSGAITNGLYCTGRQVCVGPGGPAPMAQSCGQVSILIIPIPSICPMGTTCQPVGSCTASGAVCTSVGQACPMSAGTCEVPPKTCAIGASECQDTLYETPAVTIQSLPAGLPALTRILERKTPAGGTPMGPGVRGVLAHLRARLQANPGRKVALILASDGLPDGCQRNDISSIAADLDAAFTASPSVPTYVIGVFTQDELNQARPQLDRLAMGGGTKQAFVLSATDDLNGRLLEALNQIRGAALACEYRIPTAQANDLDFGKVNVRYTSTAGPEDIPYVERLDRCDPARGGWYYDVHPSTGNPDRVLVCPATCARFRTDQSAQVELVFGCATRAID